MITPSSSDYQLPTMPDGQPLPEVKCPICFDEFAGRDVRPVIVATQCNHVFDLECVSSWISSGRRLCTLCRDVSLPLVRLDGAQWPEPSEYCENKISQLVRLGDFNELLPLFRNDENGDYNSWHEFFRELRSSPPNMLVQADSYSAAWKQACEKGNAACLQFLIESQSRCFVNDYPMLHLAVEMGRPRIVNFLINIGADVDRKWNGVAPLHIAASHCHIQCLSLLLGAEANMNLENANGEKPLDMAIKRGHEELRQYLR